MTPLDLKWSRPRVVYAERGVRQVRTASPTKSFWNEWVRNRQTLKRSGISVSKNPKTSEWEVNFWSDVDVSPEVCDGPSVPAAGGMRLPAPEGLAYLPYQREGIAEALRRPALLLADEMGLGKTIQVVGVANALGPACRNVLVVCPAALKINWRREISRWQTNRRVIHVVDGARRWPTLYREGIWVIVSYAMLTKLRSLIRETKWDLIVCDEAHYLKNRKAKRTREVVGWRPRNKPRKSHIAPLEATRRMFLTGTPITNRPIDLWSILNFLQPDVWGNWMSFVDRYCGGLDQWGTPRGATNTAELHERLRGSVMIRRTKQDVLPQLPPKRRQTYVFPAESSAEKDAIAEEGRVLDDLKAAGVAPHIAFDMIATVRHSTAVAKVPRVVQQIAETLENVDQLVVFAYHHDVIDGISEALTKQGVKVGVLDGRTNIRAKQQAIDDFQAGRTRVFVGGIQASGVGITLTAASHCVFAELDWTPANLIQAEDRLHRIGQENSISVVYLVLENSIDAKIAGKVIEKMDVFGEVLEGKSRRGIIDIVDIVSAEDEAERAA